MKEKDVLKSIRFFLDDYLLRYGFKFNAKRGNYIKHLKEERLYYEIFLLFLDKVDVAKSIKGKYLEISLHIYHEDVSKILLETTARKNLDSFFYFFLIGNRMADIYLNKDEYKLRNNLNYFKLLFFEETDFDIQSKKMLKLFEDIAFPFFDKYKDINQIKEALDRNYETALPIHIANGQRLLALSVLLFWCKDENVREKIEKIRQVLTVSYGQETMNEFNNILSYFKYENITV